MGHENTLIPAEARYLIDRGLQTTRTLPVREVIFYPAALPAEWQKPPDRIEPDDGKGVLVSGNPVHLSPGERRLLESLMSNEGNVQKYPTIIADLWGDTIAGDRFERARLTQLTHGLRQKLEVNPRIPHHIQTVHGVGLVYRNGKSPVPSPLPDQSETSDSRLIHFCTCTLDRSSHDIIRGNERIPGLIEEKC